MASEISDETVDRAVALELARLVVTVVLDIVCTVYVWNGRLEPGYATAAIITKDWIAELALEPEKEKKGALLSDMFRDIHCICDVIVCVALSLYEAQMSINQNEQVGFSAKVAIAVGCALHAPFWFCLFGSTLDDFDKSKLDEAYGGFSAAVFMLFQSAAWVLALIVTCQTNSVELAFVSVALSKVAIFISNEPEDETQVKWIKSLFFAMATAVQVILMNSQLDPPSNVAECVQKCSLSMCRIGVSIVAGEVAANCTTSCWPGKTTLPTDRMSGWLILDKEGVCAHELMLSGSQKGLFTAWTVLMSLGGLAILSMIGYNQLNRENDAQAKRGPYEPGVNAEAVTTAG